MQKTEQHWRRDFDRDKFVFDKWYKEKEHNTNDFAAVGNFINGANRNIVGALSLLL